MNYFLLPLKKYAQFKGRSRRKEYWQFFLFYIVLDIIVQVIMINVSAAIGAVLSMILTFGLLVPSLAVAVRRMHDVNKSGWYILIPIYNLILACTEGTAGPNQYGPDPKRPEFEEFLSDQPEPARPI